MFVHICVYVIRCPLVPFCSFFVECVSVCSVCDNIISTQCFQLTSVSRTPNAQHTKPCYAWHALCPHLFGQQQCRDASSRRSSTPTTNRTKSIRIRPAMIAPQTSTMTIRYRRHPNCRATIPLRPRSRAELRCRQRRHLCRRHCNRRRNHRCHHQQTMAILLATVPSDMERQRRQRTALVFGWRVSYSC